MEYSWAAMNSCPSLVPLPPILLVAAASLGTLNRESIASPKCGILGVLQEAEVLSFPELYSLSSRWCAGQVLPVSSANLPGTPVVRRWVAIPIAAPETTLETP